MNSRHFLYFIIAALPSLVTNDTPPATGWAWFKLIATGVYQGLVAVKAYQSMPTNEKLIGGKDTTLTTGTAVATLVAPPLVTTK